MPSAARPVPSRGSGKFEAGHTRNSGWRGEPETSEVGSGGQEPEAPELLSTERPRREPEARKPLSTGRPRREPEAP